MSQSDCYASIQSVTVTIDTDYPEVWEQLLAGTSTASTTVEVNEEQSQIGITSTAIERIYFPSEDVTTEALYAGMIEFTTSASEPPFAIGGGTGLNDLDRHSANYVPMFNAGVSSSESDIQQPMPVAGTLSNFYAILDGSPGNGNSYTFIVRKNGTDTTVTCTISDTDTISSDLTNSVDFDAGDLISIMATPASNPAASSMRWTAQFSPCVCSSS